MCPDCLPNGKNKWSPKAAGGCACDCHAAHRAELRLHPWETRGLGKAPFRCVGTGRETYQAVPGDSNCPIQPGTSCDYCGQGISNVAYIASADGKRFKVGFDCAEQLNSLVNKAHGLECPIARMLAEVRTRRLRMERAAREVKARKTRESVETQLADESIRAKLAAAPHPRGFVNRETGEALTLLDWAEWMMANSGAAGRAKIAKALKAL